MGEKDERTGPLVDPPSAPPAESQAGQISRQPAAPVAVAEYVASLPERLTGALLDHPTHHVHILEMNGDSYRLKRSRKNAASETSPEPDNL